MNYSLPQIRFPIVLQSQQAMSSWHSIQSSRESLTRISAKARTKSTVATNPSLTIVGFMVGSLACHLQWPGLGPACALTAWRLPLSGSWAVFLYSCPGVLGYAQTLWANRVALLFERRRNSASASLLPFSRISCFNCSSDFAVRLVISFPPVNYCLLH